ncbi:hypothetical protein A3852_02645 [Rhodococcus qingshengii]|nr:hypothetical protein A0W34_06405 [Rhodococcus sp. BH4]KZL34705.1 hypothetical protein A3852_02645 [Rhodococcus qingshengii]
MDLPRARTTLGLSSLGSNLNSVWKVGTKVCWLIVQSSPEIPIGYPVTHRHSCGVERQLPASPPFATHRAAVVDDSLADCRFDALIG